MGISGRAKGVYEKLRPMWSGQDRELQHLCRIPVYVGGGKGGVSAKTRREGGATHEVPFCTLYLIYGIPMQTLAERHDALGSKAWRSECYWISYQRLALLELGAIFFRYQHSCNDQLYQDLFFNAHEIRS